MNIPRWPKGECLQYNRSTDLRLAYEDISRNGDHTLKFGTDNGVSVGVRPVRQIFSGEADDHLVVTANAGRATDGADPGTPLGSQVTLHFRENHYPPRPGEEDSYIHALRNTGQLALQGLALTLNETGE